MQSTKIKEPSRLRKTIRQKKFRLPKVKSRAAMTYLKKSLKK
jgi:hypothetical protein